MLLLKQFLLFILLGFGTSLFFPGQLYIENPLFSFIVPLIFLLYFASLLGKETSLKKQVVLNTFFFLGFYLNIYQWIHVGLRRFNVYYPELNFVLDIVLFLWQIFHLLLIPLYIYGVEKLRVGVLGKSFVLAVILVLNEVYMALLFPSEFGYIFTHLKFLLGWSPVGGVFFYSLIIYLLFGLCVFGVNLYKKFWVGGLSFLFLIMLPFDKTSFKEESELKLRLAQTGTLDYFPHKEMEKNFSFAEQEYQKISSSLLSNLEDVDLLILSETFYPYSDFKWGEVPSQVEELISKPKAAIFGSFFVENYEGRWYRSGVANYYKNRNFQAGIYKRKLVQFAEDFPNFKLLDLLNGEKPLKDKFLTSLPKEGENHFRLGSNLYGGMLICWEILFPSFILNSSIREKDIAFIANIANESFFQDTNEQELHLFMTKMRSLEFGVPVYKVSRTGLTAVVEDGVIKNKIASGEAAFVDVYLKKSRESKTVFHRYGLLGTLFSSVLLSIFIFFGEYLWKYLQKKKL